jgi:hypothetical protein
LRVGFRPVEADGAEAGVGVGLDQHRARAS